MPNFMNAELLEIKRNLTCAHCNAKFCGSDSQARKVKYEKQSVYCSAACRKAAMQAKFGTPVPERGPCGTCGEHFKSRTAKKFCGIGCYTGSKMFSDMLADSRKKSMSPESIQRRAMAARKGCNANCLHCGVEFYQKRPAEGRTAKKFCGTPCYRSYMAARFDRWIADPQGLALPQCYDEFLDKEELRCVIDGCNWVGKHLSAHVNLSHGFVASEFKRAAGFNLNTGLVSKDVSELLSARALVGVATLPKSDPLRSIALEKSIAAKADAYIEYRSKEGDEHRAKARALQSNEPGPNRICDGCGSEFQQASKFGRALYCSKNCRSVHYSKIEKAARAEKRLLRGKEKQINSDVL